MKSFKMTHLYFEFDSVVFNEETAPAWLTSVNTKPGSTTDNRWFWEDYVLKLAVGESINTDFHVITRIE